MPSLRESRIIYRVCQSIEVRCGDAMRVASLTTNIDCIARNNEFLKIPQSINRLLSLARNVCRSLSKVLARARVDDGA